MDFIRRNVILSAVVATVSLVLITVIIVTMMHGGSAGGQDKCALSVDKPSNAGVVLKNIASTDFKALVTFAGYLSYEAKYNPEGENSEKRHMQLDLEKIDYSNDQKHLNLTTSCAKLDFNMAHDTIPERFQAYQVDVRDCKSRNGAIVPLLCSAADTIFEWSSNKHFVCNKEVTLYCFINDGVKKIRVANLTVSALAIETVGEEKDHKEGKFTHPEEECV